MIPRMKKTASPITGPEGNKEFLIIATKPD